MVRLRDPAVYELDVQHLLSMLFMGALRPLFQRVTPLIFALMPPPPPFSLLASLSSPAGLSFSCIGTMWGFLRWAVNREPKLEEVNSEAGEWVRGQLQCVLPRKSTVILRRNADFTLLFTADRSNSGSTEK